MTLIRIDPGVVRNNFAAVGPPTIHDGVLRGFSVGSRWIIPVTREEWSCRLADAGAAVWIENGAGGRPSKEDQGWIALATVSDGAAASLRAVSGIPLGAVRVNVNGHGVDVGDGTKVAPCYFSGDGGTTPRNLDDVKTGDRLFWNGSQAGYQLDASDMIDLFYDIQ